MICLVGDNNKSACHGDSGGPIYPLIGNQPRCLYGIASSVAYEGCYTSWGQGVTVFTRVSYYADWIARNMNPNNSSDDKDETSADNKDNDDNHQDVSSKDENENDDSSKDENDGDDSSKDKNDGDDSDKNDKNSSSKILSTNCIYLCILISAYFVEIFKLYT